MSLCYIISNYCGVSYYDVLWRREQEWANESYFVSRWWPPVQAHECKPNSLAIEQRAVNTPKKPRPIFQPCWSARRWKSKT